MSSSSATHVLIVGAGIGGLALAQGLKKHGIPFTIFERDPTAAARAQGYRFKVFPDSVPDMQYLLPPEVLGGSGEGGGTSAIMGAPLREARESFEREYLRVQIRRFSGNISRTASFIGMERSALHRKLKLLGITDTRDE